MSDLVYHTATTMTAAAGEEGIIIFDRLRQSSVKNQKKKKIVNSLYNSRRGYSVFG